MVGFRLLCLPFGPILALPHIFALLAVLAFVAIMWALSVYLRHCSPRTSIYEVHNPPCVPHEKWLLILGGLKCLLVLSALQLLTALETDEIVKALEYTATSAMLLRFAFKFFRSVFRALVVVVLHVACFWWCCAVHAKSPILALLMMLGSILLRLRSLTTSTERDRLQRAKTWRLDQEKSKYELFVQVLRDPVLIVEPTGLVFANSACVDLLNVTESNYQQQLLRFTADNKDTLFYRVNEAFSRNNPLSVIEDDYKCDMGDVSDKRCYKVYILNFLQQPRINTLAIVFRDLTADREREKRKAKERYHNLLFHSISHELRTPLNGIHGILPSSFFSFSHF